MAKKVSSARSRRRALARRIREEREGAAPGHRKGSSYERSDSAGHRTSASYYCRICRGPHKYKHGKS